MERFAGLLRNVWREVCRHIAIDEAVVRIALLLAPESPVGLLLVRRRDLKRSTLETVAIGQCRPSLLPERTRSDCAAKEMERLLDWCRTGRVVRGAVRRCRTKLPVVLPEGVEGDCLIRPLASAEGPLGVLVGVAAYAAGLGSEHEELFAALLEPIAVALENDRRLRELSTLREAAEADKQSLLTRLGRLDISDTIVGADSGLRAVIERVEQLARLDLPVLILGETGSGKEVIARAIHTRSRRTAGPFLRANCGAIPPELIDSELFGHERGSFTGAVAQRKGWFERADGGTLLLDEIGELPLAAQVRLLRILQDGTFQRVGGQHQLSVDVRIVAATHRDLGAMVADGRFREDLWYRIAVFPIRLPALRERTEDIPAMAMHFAMRASRRFGTPPLVPAPEDVNLLIAYPWPGNVRELSSVMDRAAILSNGQHLEVAKALGVPTAPAPPPVPAGSTPTGPPHELTSAPAALDVAMARHIEAALTRTHGRVDGRYGAARLLGINPHTLRGRMRKLAIDWRRVKD